MEIEKKDNQKLIIDLRETLKESETMQKRKEARWKAHNDKVQSKTVEEKQEYKQIER